MLQRQVNFKLRSLLNMISGDPRKFWGKIEIETYVIQSNKNKNKKL